MKPILCHRAAPTPHPPNNLEDLSEIKARLQSLEALMISTVWLKDTNYPWNHNAGTCNGCKNNVIQTNLGLCQAGRESPLGIQEEHLDKAKPEGELVFSRKLLLIYILSKA
jgi:hypothetical protein